MRTSCASQGAERKSCAEPSRFRARCPKRSGPLLALKPLRAMPTHARQSDSVQLLVVGAGPVGLFAALTAARLGIRVRVIDQVWRGYAPGHATLLHASSLELLEEAGVAARIRA